MWVDGGERVRQSGLGGMRGFTAIWLGQLVSVLATQMTAFGVTLWAYERTGSATALGLTQVFYMTPFLLISPLAGALVDRHDRKRMMMVSDVGAGLGTVALLALQAIGRLELWHLYAANAVMGTFQAFQWPAYSAAITTLVPKEQYGRANGMMSLVEVGPGILAPLLAGALLPFIGLTGILVTDVVTFVLAVGVLLFVHVPEPEPTGEGQRARGALWRESLYGFRYILERPGLLGLQLVFFGANLMWNLGFTVLAPMILERTHHDELAFGTAQSVGAVGGVVGGLVMSAWGGPKRRVHGVLLGWVLSGVLGQALLGLGQGLPVWAVGLFLGGVLGPVVNGSNQALWQAKVMPDVQGRVFATRRLIAAFTVPLAPLLAGPLTDRVLEPGMREGGALVGVFGRWVGTGPGAGMALLFVLSGVLVALVGAVGYLFPALRGVEELLPDHDAGPRSAGAAVESGAA